MHELVANGPGNICSALNDIRRIQLLCCVWRLGLSASHMQTASYGQLYVRTLWAWLMPGKSMAKRTYGQTQIHDCAYVWAFVCSRLISVEGNVCMPALAIVFIYKYLNSWEKLLRFCIQSIFESSKSCRIVRTSYAYRQRKRTSK